MTTFFLCSSISITKYQSPNPSLNLEHYLKHFLFAKKNLVQISQSIFYFSKVVLYFLHHFFQSTGWSISWGRGSVSLFEMAWISILFTICSSSITSFRLLLPVSFAFCWLRESQFQIFLGEDFQQFFFFYLLSGSSNN